MADPEGNNNWTQNVYGKGKILPEQVNNEWSAIGEPGIQAAIREILHSRETAMLLMDSSTGNLAPTGTYASCNVANGYIMTRNSDGLSRVVLCAAVTALNINLVTRCVVASNNGVISVKDKTSVLSTDVIIAVRGNSDNALVDVRNLKTEDDILSMNVGVLRSEVLNPRIVGVDSNGYRTIVLKNGDDLGDAITALGGAGTIVLLPGTYTDSVTLNGAISIVGSSMGTCSIVGTVTMAAASCMLSNVKITGNVVVNAVAKCVVDQVYVIAASSYGINAPLADDVQITKCYVTGTPSVGIFSSGSRPRIIGNTIDTITSGENEVSGIGVLGSYAIVVGNTVQNIICTHDDGDGLGIQVSGANCVISGNVVYNVTHNDGTGDFTGILVVGGSYCSVTGNTVSTIGSATATSATGIKVSTANWCTVTGNVVYTITAKAGAGGLAYGIDMSTTDGCTCTGNSINTVAGNVSQGLYSHGGNENVNSVNNMHGETISVTGTNDLNDHNNNS